MIRMCFIIVFSCCLLTVAGQDTSHNLSYYVEVARNYSPLLHDYRNQLQIEQAELQRLKAMYTRSRLELNGDYLFVPVITKDGGQTSFQWNARDVTDYYGYDLGESSGYLKGHRDPSSTVSDTLRQQYQIPLIMSIRYSSSKPFNRYEDNSFDSSTLRQAHPLRRLAAPAGRHLRLHADADQPVWACCLCWQASTATRGCRPTCFPKCSSRASPSLPTRGSSRWTV